MIIKHKENESMGLFYIEGEKGVIAELSYVKNDQNHITIDHTEVKRDMEGKGIGSSLVAKVVEFARENNLRVHPLCPFAEVQFDENPNYNDVRS